jgi:hypothetical protein
LRQICTPEVLVCVCGHTSGLLPVGILELPTATKLRGVHCDHQHSNKFRVRLLCTHFWGTILADSKKVDEPKPKVITR